VLNNKTGLLVKVVPGVWPPKYSSNNRVCCPYVCFDTPIRALECVRDQHFQIQPRSPLIAVLLTIKERFTVPIVRAIRVTSIVRWKHTELVVRYRPTRGEVTTKQTSQVSTTRAHIIQPKLMTAPRDRFPPCAPHRISPFHVLLLFG
jgi:hypothetical protein